MATRHGQLARELVRLDTDEPHATSASEHNLSTSQDEKQRLLRKMEVEIGDAAYHLHHLEAALLREHGKDHPLLAMIERLKQSIASRDAENSSLLKDLRSSAEHQHLAEKKFMDEIASLQAEEQKLQGEMMTQSAIATELKEKVAGLRMENAALHEDLSLKIELSLKLQKDVEDLSQEEQRLSEALQEMVAEMTPLKDDLYFFKEVMVPSLEERSIELENENTELRDTNQKYMTEVDIMREQVCSVNAEILRLHEENALLEVQLIISYGMLKHGEGVVSTVKEENLKLQDDLRLKEQLSNELVSSLGTASDDVEDLRKKLCSATEERMSMQSAARRLMVVLNGVKQLQEELTIARGVVSLPGANEFGGVHAPSSNGRGSSRADESTSSVDQGTSPPAHTALLQRLRDEILYLQEEVKRDFRLDGPKSLLSPGKTSVVSSAIMLGAKDDERDPIYANIQRLTRENQRLVEENHAVCMENTTIENTIKELQENLMFMQEKNDQLNDYVSSFKAEIRRLEEECLLWKGKNGDLRKDIEGTLATKKRSEETIGKLKEDSAVREERNRHLHAQIESVSTEVNELHAAIASLEKEGMVFVGMLRTKMVETLGEVKLVLEGCKEYVGDAATVPALKKFEHYLHKSTAFYDEGDEGSVIEDSSIHASLKPDDEGSAMDVHTVSKTCDNGISLHLHGEESAMGSRGEAVSANKMHILTELQARAEEANILLEVMESLRKLLVRSWSGEHTFHPGTLHEECETDKAAKVAEQMIPVMHEEESELMVQHHINQGKRLNQAFMDENLEKELLELKQGRKQLKEELGVRLEDVVRMDKELEEWQGMLQARGDDSLGQDHGGRQESERKDAIERAKEFRQILLQQRRQIERMEEEMMCMEEQQEAAAENQVNVLVSMESAVSTKGGDEERINFLRKEMVRLKALNKKHSLELGTMRQDLQSMASIIKSARDQFLLWFSLDSQGELISTADLRIHDQITEDSRISVDSTQELLSPPPEGPVPISRPLPLKPRHFEWFLLMFSPDRKASLGTNSTSNKRWTPMMLRKLMHKSGTSGSPALLASRRKLGGCLACVSATSRLDSFDQR